MAEKANNNARMVIDDTTTTKLDALRGEMSRQQFLSNLLEAYAASSNERHFVTREEFDRFAEKTQKALNGFLDFVLNREIENPSSPHRPCYTLDYYDKYSN